MRSILLQHANFKVSEEGLVNEILKLNQFVFLKSSKFQLDPILAAKVMSTNNVI